MDSVDVLNGVRVGEVDVCDKLLGVDRGDNFNK